jgi:large subunit ribosomal protein L54
MSPVDGGEGQGDIEATAVLSSVPAGTPLQGLDIYKGKEAPVAMEDSAYPEWLWTVLDEGKPPGDAAGAMGKHHFLLTWNGN